MYTHSTSLSLYIYIYMCIFNIYYIILAPEALYMHGNCITSLSCVERLRKPSQRIWTDSILNLNSR